MELVDATTLVSVATVGARDGATGTLWLLLVLGSPWWLLLLLLLWPPKACDSKMPLLATCKALSRPSAACAASKWDTLGISDMLHLVVVGVEKSKSVVAESDPL